MKKNKTNLHDIPENGTHNIPTVEPVFWNWRNQKCTSLLKSLSMCRMLW